MKHKFFRALEYAKQLLLLLFFLPAGFLVKLLCPKFRHVWLVMERGNDARDNGYHFYRYLKTAHPEIRAYYVIDPKSPDRDKIAPLGGLVNYRSFRHYLLYYAADYLISTHVQPCAPDMILFYHLAPKHIGSPAKQIFLQHGIIKDEMKWLHRENLKIDLFVCGAKPEYEYIKSTFGHPENVPQYLGLCRFDHLLCASKPEKMILVMPTWRGSRYPVRRGVRKYNVFSRVSLAIKQSGACAKACRGRLYAYFLSSCGNAEIHAVISRPMRQAAKI